jgi:phosphotransacetylase
MPRASGGWRISAGCGNYSSGAAKKVKGESPVAGRANILVFPNLGAGNIGVKMTQIFAGAVANGPILQGFAKNRLRIFPALAPVEEMVGNHCHACGTRARAEADG